MNTEHTILEKHIKRANYISTTLSIVVTILTATTIAYGFYYNTKDTLNDHSIQINEIKVEVKEIKEAVNSSAVFQGASTEQIKSLENQMNDVKSSQLRIEEKIDKLILRSK